MGEDILKPLFKYPGGKGSEYKYLKKLFPEFKTYVEPFVGGGAVFWAINADKWIINDFSKELISIYSMSKKQNILFLQYITEMGNLWREKKKYINEVAAILKTHEGCISSKIKKISEELREYIHILPISVDDLQTQLEVSILRKSESLEKIGKNTKITNWTDNAFGVLGDMIYMCLRSLYNSTSYRQEPELKTALYYFMREYSYSSMFRYNADGGFNVPFGGNTYAKKEFDNRVEQVQNEDVLKKLGRTTIRRGDFSKAFIDADDTFMFLDPPYDTEFSTYNLHVFDAKEQIRLRDELKKIKKTKWLMVVKATEFIEELYDNPEWYKEHFDKTYSVNFKNRNEQDVQHLVIANYKMEVK